MMISQIDIQRNNLCTFLANPSHKLKSNMNVYCVYYNEKIDDDLITLQITILTSNTKTTNDIIKYLGYDSESSGFKIYLKIDNVAKCLNKFHNDSNDEFINSIILFDKTGDFTELKRQISIKNINQLIKKKSNN